MVIPLDKKRADASAASLVEAGPRLAMNPNKIFAGSFGGATLFENPNYVSPNAVRALLRRAWRRRWRCTASPLLVAGSRRWLTRPRPPARLPSAQIRAMLKKQKAGKYTSKVGAQQKRREHEAANPLPRSELDDIFRG